MKVKCVSNIDGFTLGKIYDLIDEIDEYLVYGESFNFILEDDDKQLHGFRKDDKELFLTHFKFIHTHRIDAINNILK